MSHLKDSIRAHLHILARELDPLSLSINPDKGKMLYYPRRHDEAIEELRKTLEMDPNFGQALGYLSAAYYEKGMRDETVAELEKLSAVTTLYWKLMDLGLIDILSGRRGAQKAINQLKQLAKTEYIDPAAFAGLYVYVGDKDQAFAWLEKEYKERSTGLTSLKVNPMYDSLRSDPRFADHAARWPYLA